MDSDAGRTPDTPTGNAGPAVITPAEAAQALGVSERTVRRRIAAGSLPDGWAAEKTPDGWRVTTPDLAVKTLKPAVKDNAGQVTQELRARIAALEADLAWLRGKLDAADTERRALTERLSLPAATVDTEAMAAEVARQVQEALAAQQDQADALGPLRELVETQAGKLQELRTELQAERERRGWWRRLFGSREGR